MLSRTELHHHARRILISDFVSQSPTATHKRARSVRLFICARMLPAKFRGRRIALSSRVSVEGIQALSSHCLPRSELRVSLENCGFERNRTLSPVCRSLTEETSAVATCEKSPPPPPPSLSLMPGAIVSLEYRATYHDDPFDPFPSSGLFLPIDVSQSAEGMLRECMCACVCVCCARTRTRSRDSSRFERLRVSSSKPSSLITHRLARQSDGILTGTRSLRRGCSRIPDSRPCLNPHSCTALIPMIPRCVSLSSSKTSMRSLPFFFSFPITCCNNT